MVCTSGEHNPSHIGAPGFTTTHWSAVVRAGTVPSREADDALAELCRAYWYPLYAFIRRRGYRPHDAEDLTQGFLTRVLEKNYLASARRDAGRFRTFLLTALKRFLANEWDHRRAQKRGGGQTIVSIDHDLVESRLEFELAGGEQPDVLFERQWAMALLDRVMACLEEEAVAAGRQRLFQCLRSCITRDESASPYAEIAKQLVMTEAAVKMAAHRLRNRYRQILRLEIAKTVDSADDVEAEIHHLYSVFAP